MGKNVLIVYAHPGAKSLNGALLEKAKTSLEGQGHKVTVSDLYAMNWDPVPRKSDITGDLEDPETFNYATEMARAYSEGLLTDAIKAEQAKVDAADLVIFQFPIYWMGLPAILKGWFDKIMMIMYAWEPPHGMMENGRFKGKRAMISFTTAGPGSWFTNIGQMGDINVHLWPLHVGQLRFIGFDIMAPNILYGVEGPPNAAIPTQIEEFGKRLENIFDESPLKFCTTSDFEPLDPSNPSKGQGLKKAVQEVNGQFGPTVGQHCGKLIPQDQQTKAPQ